MSQQILARLKVMRGCPSAEAMRYKQQVCSLFLSRQKSGLTKLILLQTAANGDWRNQENIEHYLPHDAPEDINYREISW
eukprot:5237523-Amphidinium_carterae.1